MPAIFLAKDRAAEKNEDTQEAARLSWGEGPETVTDLREPPEGHGGRLRPASGPLACGEAPGAHDPILSKCAETRHSVSNNKTFSLLGDSI